MKLYRFLCDYETMVLDINQGDIIAVVSRNDNGRIVTCLHLNSLEKFRMFWSTIENAAEEVIPYSVIPRNTR
jgi:hypothetical protein